MKKMIVSMLFAWMMLLPCMAQEAALAKVYNEEINPLEQIDQAVAKAKADGHYVICQVGGNWCPWCLRFADFITKDAEIDQLIKANFEYIHVNYPRRGAAEDLSKRLANAGRLGFPVFVVFDQDGKVIHLQDSSYLEEGKGYNKDKVMRFFNNWTPAAVTAAK